MMADKRDPYLDYWIEAVENSLDENTLIPLTRESIFGIAKDMMRAHEMHGEAFGTYNIPNPMATEAKKLQEKLKQQQNSEEERERQWKAAVLRSRGLREDSYFVSMDNRGHVVVEDRR